MNEFFFFTHVILVVVFLWAAAKRGKEALLTLFVVQAIFANFFVVKQMTLFGLEVTCSDVYAIGSILALNIMQELFGKEAAKHAVGISLLSCLFFVFMSQIHLFYAPAPSDHTHAAFIQIFSATPRIVAASVGVYWIVQQLDLRFFAYLSSRLPSFSLRVAMSLIVSQTLDTILFSFFGLYGIAASLFDIILISLLTKWVAIGCTVPMISFLRRPAS